MSQDDNFRSLLSSRDEDVEEIAREEEIDVHAPRAHTRPTSVQEEEEAEVQGEEEEAVVEEHEDTTGMPAAASKEEAADVLLGMVHPTPPIPSHQCESL